MINRGRLELATSPMRGPFSPDIKVKIPTRKSELLSSAMHHLPNHSPNFSQIQSSQIFPYMGKEASFLPLLMHSFLPGFPINPSQQRKGVTLSFFLLNCKATQKDYYGRRCCTLLHSYCTGTYTEVTMQLL